MGRLLHLLRSMVLVLSLACSLQSLPRRCPRPMLQINWMKSHDGEGGSRSSKNWRDVNKNLSCVLESASSKLVPRNESVKGSGSVRRPYALAPVLLWRSFLQYDPENRLRIPHSDHIHSHTGKMLYDNHNRRCLTSRRATRTALPTWQLHPRLLPLVVSLLALPKPHNRHLQHTRLIVPVPLALLSDTLRLLPPINL